MLSENIQDFLRTNHLGVLTTYRKSGASQMSVINCGLYGSGVAFTTPADRAKLWNLKRDPRCSLLVSQPDWWGYVVLEGHGVLMSSENTEAEELRLALRDVYRVAGGGEHPDWDEYDQVMKEERRSVVAVVPDHVYGTKA